jgi:hypothetical protein
MCEFNENMLRAAQADFTSELYKHDARALK